MSTLNRSVFVACKPESGNWHPLGRLSFIDGLYKFVYLKGIQEQSETKLIPGMPDVNEVYKSKDLFPFFENRLLSHKRSEYDNFLAWSDFDASERPNPLAIFEVTEGRKITDSYEIFPCPTQSNEFGHYEFKFFLHGLKHFPGSALDELNHLNEGDTLLMMPDVHNTYNKSAIALRTDRRVIIGYLPNYMTDEAYRLVRECSPELMDFTVSKINLEAPLNFRILCKLDACWSEESKPFSDNDFLPIPEGEPERCDLRATG